MQPHATDARRSALSTASEWVVGASEALGDPIKTVRPRPPHSVNAVVSSTPAPVRSPFPMGLPSTAPRDGGRGAYCAAALRTVSHASDGKETGRRGMLENTHTNSPDTGTLHIRICALQWSGTLLYRDLGEQGKQRFSGRATHTVAPPQFLHPGDMSGHWLYTACRSSHHQCGPDAWRVLQPKNIVRGAPLTLSPIRVHSCAPRVDVGSQQGARGRAERRTQRPSRAPLRPVLQHGRLVVPPLTVPTPDATTAGLFPRAPRHRAGAPVCAPFPSPSPPALCSPMDKQDAWLGCIRESGCWFAASQEVDAEDVETFLVEGIEVAVKSRPLWCIHLARNRLTKLSCFGWSAAWGVRVLDISFNPLRHWPRDPLRALAATLRSLTATDCPFTTADVTGLVHVRWLDLARNQLRAPPDGLAGLTNLDVLNLADNQITARDWPAFVANIVNVEHNPVCRSPGWSVSVTSRNGDADPTVVGLSRELPAPPRLAAVPADANGGATDDEGAASHPPVVDDGQEEDGTAADGGREEGTPSSETVYELVDCSTDEDGDKDGSGDADGKEGGSGDADDKEGGSGDADGKEGGSGDADGQKQGRGDADDDNEDSEGIYESDVDVSDMVDADEGAATANDPMQVDPPEDGVATGCGTVAGSVNGIVEDGGKGGDDQHDGVGVDMGGVVDGGDANRATG